MKFSKRIRRSIASLLDSKEMPKSFIPTGNGQSKQTFRDFWADYRFKEKFINSRCKKPLNKNYV